MNFSDRVYEIMRKKKMNQSAVARAAGFDPKVFNAILRGRKLLREEYVSPICEALDETPNTLFGFSDDQKN
ncbi:helix-turn-helix domain-containing protein [Fumia xinanensis]|uniref:Helix-turn-helix transcriptional regulator n=1 Tax=Fumia xinanensis TaxID=2763659 RepID=A0A926E3F8_9FIRM|nr:helix-turn-helix transcriptional regulator [Fumia xinanensis]